MHELREALMQKLGDVRAALAGLHEVIDRNPGRLAERLRGASERWRHEQTEEVDDASQQRDSTV